MSGFDLTPDINTVLEYHMGWLRQEIAAENYRGAWKHAWALTATLYYKAQAEYEEQEQMGGKPL